MTTTRPIDDPEVRAQLRRQACDVFGTVITLVFGLAMLLMTPLFALLIIGGAVTGNLGIVAESFLGLGICAVAGVLGGAVLAAVVSPAVFFFAHARRRALQSPWRAAHCITWKVEDRAHALVLLGARQFICSLGTSDNVPGGSWHAQLADRKGRWIVLRPVGSPVLLLAWRRAAPLQWTTQRVGTWQEVDGVISVHVRADDREIRYQFATDESIQRADEVPNSIEIAKGGGRVVIRVPGRTRPVVATSWSRARPRRERRAVSRSHGADQVSIADARTRSSSLVDDDRRVRSQTRTTVTATSTPTTT
jgi:hypothetical protein